jgi:hypothetical protein
MRPKSASNGLLVMAIAGIMAGAQARHALAAPEKSATHSRESLAKIVDPFAVTEITLLSVASSDVSPSQVIVVSPPPMGRTVVQSPPPKGGIVIPPPPPLP